MIYSIDDLCNINYDDTQIDDVSRNLQNSLIIGMFRHINNNELSDKEICKLCRNDSEWFNQFTWTIKQRNSYIKKIEKILYNLYRFNKNKCENSAFDWVMTYGFKLKTIPKKTIKTNELF